MVVVSAVAVLLVVSAVDLGCASSAITTPESCGRVALARVRTS